VCYSENIDMRVLIVEDDPILLKMYREKFEKSDFDVDTAVEGEAGLFKAINDQPDFIVLDLMMPKMDGVQALKKLKEDVRTKNIPVAILTVIPQDQASGLTKELSDQIVYYWMKDVVKPSGVVEDTKKYLLDTKND